jgi:hypothetical protein
MKKLLPILLALAPVFSQACSFAPGYVNFKPALASFEVKLDGDRIAPLPLPSVNGIQVKRGTASPSSLCGDAGTLSLNVSVPKTSAYKLKELGFYFRVLSGTQPDQIFPLEPISGLAAGGQAQFFFAWLDDHPSNQRPLNLEVEVFAVNKGLQIGPSKKFRIADEKR